MSSNPGGLIVREVSDQSETGLVGLPILTAIRDLAARGAQVSGRIWKTDGSVTFVWRFPTEPDKTLAITAHEEDD